MKRVTYISRFATHLSKDEINAIAEISEKNNKMD